MKLTGVIGTAVLSLSLGVAVPAYAQQEQHDQQEEQKAKPEDEKKAQPEKPAKQGEKRTQQDNKQQEKNAQQQDKNKQQEEKSAQQQEQNGKQQEKNAQQQDRNKQQEEKNAQQQPTQRAEPVKQAQHGGGGRIPEDRFRANFGREHSFRVSHEDYSRDRRFQYGGYWFGFVDPWPSNWLYTQDVFVVEIDGVYYLCNASYPGVNVTLNISM
jgi:hypothetical protein